MVDASGGTGTVELAPRVHGDVDMVQDVALDGLLHRLRRGSRGSDPAVCAETARACAEVYWRTGRWDEALTCYMEASLYHAPYRPAV